MALDTWLIRAENQDTLLSGAYGATLAHADFLDGGQSEPYPDFGTNFRRFKGTGTSVVNYFQALNPNTGSIPLIPVLNNQLEIASDTLKSSGTAIVTGSTSGATATLSFNNNLAVQSSNFVNELYLTNVQHMLMPTIVEGSQTGIFLSGETLISTDGIINGKKIINSAVGFEYNTGRKIILQCAWRGSVNYFGFGFWRGFYWPGISYTISTSTPYKPAAGFAHRKPNQTMEGIVIDPSANVVSTAYQTWGAGTINKTSSWQLLRVVLNEKQEYYLETGKRISVTHSLYTRPASKVQDWSLEKTITIRPPAPYTSGTPSPGSWLWPGFFFQTNDSSSYLDIDQIEVLVEDTGGVITTWF